MSRPGEHVSLKQRREDVEGMLAQVVVGQIQQYLLERTPLVLDAEVVTGVSATEGDLRLTLESGRVILAVLGVVTLGEGMTDEQLCDECRSPNVSQDPVVRQVVHDTYHVER